MTPLRVGLLGLEGIGLVYRDALRASALFDLVSIADSSAERVRKAGTEADVTAFEDCRSLVAAQTRDPIDALFVTLPPHQSVELLPLAAQRGVPVFHHTPFARSADECQRLAQIFRESDGTFEAVRLWQTLLPFDTPQEIFDRTGRVFATHACVQRTKTATNWRGDAQRAGGGALLHAGYDAVDAMVTLLGLPESVCAECSSAASPSATRGYDTEDAAVVMLRFGRGEVGSLTVWRGADENRWEVTLVGADATVSIRQPCAAEGDSETDEAYVASSVRSGVEAFGRRLRDATTPSGADLPAAAHVATLATIDAAYLSSKTGSAEVPAQFIQESVR